MLRWILLMAFVFFIPVPCGTEPDKATLFLSKPRQPMGWLLLQIDASETKKHSPTLIMGIAGPGATLQAGDWPKAGAGPAGNGKRSVWDLSRALGPENVAWEI